MRNIWTWMVAGLALGSLGMWAYGSYLGDGAKLARVQADLTAARASLAALQQTEKELKTETDAESAQVQQLAQSNHQLKQQLGAAPQTAGPATSPFSPGSPAMAGLIKTAMDQQEQQKLLLLESRLHLTPEQIEAVKAAMAEERKRTEAMATTMFQGGKIDLQSMKNTDNVKSVDQTLDDILTPDQKTAYTQMQTDQKESSAETMATVEMNEFAPALQLTDAQKDQVYTALYQVQMDSQNPATISAASAGSSDPLALMEAQAQVKENALAKILTPDQLATYHQQVQSQLQMQKTMMQKFSNGGAVSFGVAPAPTPTP